MGLAVYTGSSSVVSMELRWVRRRKNFSNYPNKNSRQLKELNASSALPLTIPIYISTQKKDVKMQELRDLYVQCNHSCNRFPNLEPNSGRVEEIMNVEKLSTAISHSAAVVSVFCKPHHANLVDAGCLEDERTCDAAVLYSEEGSGTSSLPSSEIRNQNNGISSLRDLFQNFVVSVTPSNGQLVGFGRAVSDYGLTASIYDVMVIPSLQQMGIGKLIVKRIIRFFMSREIYDIAALCSERERLFFRACGFGDDMLGSTTMMYTKTLKPSGDQITADLLVRRVGRRVLVAPPPRSAVGSSSDTTENKKINKR